MKVKQLLKYLKDGFSVPEAYEMHKILEKLAKKNQPK